MNNADDASSRTVGEMQSLGMPDWMANDDVVEGWEFSATIQLRTPLRVLRWHRRIVRDKHNPPPKIAREQWEGIWIPRAKPLTEEELGFKLPPATMASDIGPIPADGGEYLQFLIAIREIVEPETPIADRIAVLRKALADARWAHFAKSQADVDRYVNYFFPFFLSMIPRVSVAATRALRERGLDTPERLASASDQTLLAIKGIGPAGLRDIRNYCARITQGCNLDRMDAVQR